MKRALSANENTLVVIYILYLHGLITESNEPRSSHENMKSIIEALRSSNVENIKVVIATLTNTLWHKIAVKKLESSEENIKNNNTF